MHLTRYALALAASAFLAGAAAAQPATSSEPTMPDASAPPADTTAAPVENTIHMPDATSEPAAPAATSAGTDVSATLGPDRQFTAMQPIPDTRENRKKYGQPLSHLGRQTAAKGN